VLIHGLCHWDSVRGELYGGASVDELYGGAGTIRPLREVYIEGRGRRWDL
jgi:hypothetical protein